MTEKGKKQYTNTTNSRTIDTVLNQIQRIYEHNEFTSLVCLPGYTTSPSMGSISLSQ
jgi:hypothetical protein